jgi:hypothetical protein
VSVVVNKDVTSGYGVRQPIEYKKDVVPRTPNPTYGMWLGCRARLSHSEYFHNLAAHPAASSATAVCGKLGMAAARHAARPRERTRSSPWTMLKAHAAPIDWRQA